MAPIEGVSPSVYKDYIEQAVACWSGQCLPEDPAFGLGEELIKVARIRRTAEEIKANAAKRSANPVPGPSDMSRVLNTPATKRSVNPAKRAAKKLAKTPPLLFTVRVNTEDKLGVKFGRVRALVPRIKNTRTVRNKALDSRKGTAFTLKVDMEPGAKARDVANRVRQAVQVEFGEHAEVKRQYEGR